MQLHERGLRSGDEWNAPAHRSYQQLYCMTELQPVFPPEPLMRASTRPSLGRCEADDFLEPCTMDTPTRAYVDPRQVVGIGHFADGPLLAIFRFRYSTI